MPDTEKTPEELAAEEAAKVVDTPKTKSAEDRAAEMGWVPEEEWDNPDKEWVGASEFLSRASFFKKISSLKYEIDQMRTAMQARETQHAKTLEAQREKLIKELRQEKRQAMEDGEYDKVMEIDENLEEIRSTPVEEAPVVQAPPPEFTEWVGNNDWYANNPVLQKEADTVGEIITKHNPNLPFKDVLDRVAKQIKTQHPEFFPKPRVNKVEPSKTSGQQQAATKKNKSIQSLPEADRRIAQTLIRNKVMTEAEYMAEYEATNN